LSDVLDRFKLMHVFMGGITFNTSTQFDGLVGFGR